MPWNGPWRTSKFYGTSPKATPKGIHRRPPTMRPPRGLRYDTTSGTATITPRGAGWRSCGYPERYREQLPRALMEAWAWLEREGLLVPAPGQEGWYFVSRRGRQVTRASDLATYRRADLLPQRLLHPVTA